METNTTTKVYINKSGELLGLAMIDTARYQNACDNDEGHVMAGDVLEDADIQRLGITDQTSVYALVSGTQLITPDKMNDIIGKWVDAELPKPLGGYGSSDDEDAAAAAREKRFLEISNLPEGQFAALYERNEGAIVSRESDGSYTVNA